MRFLTYNIRHGEGVDGWVSNRRIASVIAGIAPDVVGVNEVWHIRGLWDQPDQIARMLNMEHAFEPNHTRWVHALGNMVMANEGTLCSASNLFLPGGMERRGALVAEISAGGTPITFVSTHLSLGRRTREAQIAFLAENLPRDTPLVLAGDLNCQAAELTVLSDLLEVVENPPSSFPSIRPNRGLDHFAYSRHWKLEALEAVPSRASDHLPVYADLVLR
ncbi:MAG: endonuclease/exonuclease/phosphatase family protein [Coriobacteriia bacterium]